MFGKQFKTPKLSFANAFCRNERKNAQFKIPEIQKENRLQRKDYGVLVASLYRSFRCFVYMAIHRTQETTQRANFGNNRSCCCKQEPSQTLHNLKLKSKDLRTRGVLSVFFLLKSHCPFLFHQVGVVVSKMCRHTKN